LATGASDASAAARPGGTVAVPQTTEQRGEGAGKLAARAPDELAHARFLLALLRPRRLVEPELCKPVGVLSVARLSVAEAPQLPAFALAGWELMVVGLPAPVLSVPEAPLEP